jgi:uracil-DNA glycosylase family 4
MLQQCGIDRDSVRIANCVSCQPPGDWLAGAPWEKEAIAHCNRHLQPVLEEDHEVVVALGATAGRTLTGDSRCSGELWHGCTVPTLHGVVVPTFHPAYILRGNHSLTGTVAFDILKAKEVAQEGFHLDHLSLIVDPPVEEFEAWVQQYLESCRQGQAPWLAVDTEWDGKAAKAEDQLVTAGNEPILRFNFSYNPDEGLTVPNEGGYVDGILKLLHTQTPKLFWYFWADVPKMRMQGRTPYGPLLDTMDMWHVLQSDLTNSLGFVAPFYSGQMEPWKHLHDRTPGPYAALDALHTLRIAFGVARDLQKNGMWEAYYRHCFLLDKQVLRPAEDAGLLVDKDELRVFGEDLTQKKQASNAKAQKLVPESVRPLYPKAGWKRKPDKPNVIQRRENALVQVCLACNQAQVAKTHRCADKSLKPKVELQEREVDRYYIREPFNPGSSTQMLAYIKHKKLKPGKNKKSKSPSSDEKTLKRLAKGGDPLFKEVLAYRKVDKVLGTYVKGTWKRVKEDGRLHCRFTHKPSTLRLSCLDPNLQNVVSDKEGSEALAAGFRRCLVASEGHLLVEADFGGIEAVETGWYADDQDYMRLARMGVHAYLCSHLVSQPADLSWSDEDLAGYLADIKKGFPGKYAVAKKGVHRTNYGSTPYGMQADNPEIFETVRDAEEIQQLYYSICPKLFAFHEAVRNRAHKQHYLGGQDHPFKYKHWFWNVYVFNSKTKKYSLGEDGKRCVAFYPQSTAAGVLYESCLRLLDRDNVNYIGDFCEGRTPIRALIHDSILAEVPRAKLGGYVDRVRREMTKPIKQQGGLVIDVEIKAGERWSDMEVIE